MFTLNFLCINELCKDSQKPTTSRVEVGRMRTESVGDERSKIVHLHYTYFKIFESRHHISHSKDSSSLQGI